MGLESLSWSDCIAIASMVIAAIALMVSWFAILRSNKTSSSSSLISLNEAFRQGWSRFLSARDNEEKMSHEFHELANILEIACAIYLDRAFTGRPKKILKDYLDANLLLIKENEFTCQMLLDAVDAPDTFICIAEYLKKTKTKKDSL